MKIGAKIGFSVLLCCLDGSEIARVFMLILNECKVLGTAVSLRVCLVLCVMLLLLLL